tara:strand:+ start:594 stop:773 length:180 start_codon:yes stop_codon:yes gene_type:complete
MLLVLPVRLALLVQLDLLDLKDPLVQLVLSVHKELQVLQVQTVLMEMDLLEELIQHQQE